MIELVGWTLVHAGWEGGIIAALVALLLCATARSSSAIRYAISLAGLFLSVALPVATTMATRSLIKEPSTAVEATVSERTANAVATPAVEPSVQRVRRQTTATMVSPLTLERFRRPIRAKLPWLVALWVVGISLLSVRTIAGVARIRSLGRDGVSAAGERTREIAARIGERLGIRRAIRVLSSSAVNVPMVIGWLRPVVLVPVGLLSGIELLQLEMLLAHEIAHIRRHDTIVNFAQTIVETLLFFHPAIWWLSARVRDERENCCDDIAIALCQADRGAYGGMLLRLEEARSTVTLAAAATDGSLLRRVRRIVLGRPARADLGATWFAGIATMLAALFIVLPSAPAAAARVIHSASKPAAVAPMVSRNTLVRSTPKRASSVDTNTSSAKHPTVQSLSRSSTMPRTSLLATAAALTMAAANVTAQVPNLSGRWVSVGTPDRVTTAGLSTSDSSFVLEQTARTLSISADAKGDLARVTFQIQSADAGTVHVMGPVSATYKTFEVTFDPTAAKPQVHAAWDGGSFTLDAPDELTRSINFSSMTFALDHDDLVITVDAPAAAGKQATHAVQRFHRG